MSVNSKTTRSGRKKIWSRLACVAIYYYSSSCSLQSAEACPFFQKKIGQQKQQQSKTAGSTEDDCSSPHDDAALYSQQVWPMHMDGETRTFRVVAAVLVLERTANL